MSVKVAPNTEATEAGEQPVAGAMAGAIAPPPAIDPRRHHHVEAIFHQARDHGAHARRVVGGVAVDQHVDVGLDVGEHAPHHVALALVRLAPDHRTGGARRPRRCGRSNCCRRHRSSASGSAARKSATTLAMAVSSLKQGTSTAPALADAAAHAVPPRGAVDRLGLGINSPLSQPGASRICRLHFGALAACTIAFLCSRVLLLRRLALGRHRPVRKSIRTPPSTA